jgi:hypothetical protein
VSGLFSALLESAMGAAQVAAPRPDARFAPGDGRASGIEWSEAQGESQPDQGAARSEVTIHRQAPAVGAKPSPQPRAVPLLPPRQADSARSGPVAPTLEIAIERPKPAHGNSRPAEGGIRPTRDGRDLRSEPELLQSSQAGSRDTAVRPILPERQVPLGDLVREIDGPSDKSAPPSQSPTLTIGRIEVRAPPDPTTPPPRQVPALTTRSVSVPRAAVRQSLDDYRAGRRR